MKSDPGTVPGSVDEAGSQESWPQRFYFFGGVIRLEAECLSVSCLSNLYFGTIPLLYSSTPHWLCGCHGNNFAPIITGPHSLQKDPTVACTLREQWEKECLLNFPTV